MDNRKSRPLYFLLGHAIELALKAFLISTAMTESEVKKHSHDLDLSLTTARNFGLKIALSEEQLAMLKIFNTLYMSQRLKYFFPEPQSFGSVEDTQLIVKILLDDVFNAVTKSDFDAMKI